MEYQEPDTERALQALSRILRRDLQSFDSMMEPGAVTVSRRLEDQAYSIHAPSSSDFTPDERELIEEIVNHVVEARHSRSEVARLEERLRTLEREAIDLTMRNRALADVSAKDALTGLYSRWYVMEKIEEELNRAMRHGTAVAVMMVDLDHFKRVNDQYGHLAGDHVLQTMGQLLKDSLRVYDIPGRYGGEEFCLMLPETPLANTGIVAERIRKNVEATPVDHENHPIHITASIGVAGLDQTTGTMRAISASELVDRADRALYRAKETGRNRVERWDEILVHELESAVSH